MSFVLCLAALVAAFLVLVRAFVEIEGRYRHGREMDALQIWFRAPKGLWEATYQVPMKGRPATSAAVQFVRTLLERGHAPATPIAPDGPATRLVRYRDAARAYVGIVDYLSHRAYFAVLETKVRFGLDDAAATGVAGGAGWMAAGGAMAYLRHRLRFAPGQPRFELHPVFAVAALDVTVHCIFKIRIGHIMVAIAKAGVAAAKMRKAPRRS